MSKWGQTHVKKCLAIIAAALEVEAEHAPCLAAKVLLRKVVVSVPLEPRIAHTVHLHRPCPGI